MLSAKSPSQQPTVLFSIYQNNTWTIRHLVAETIDPATQRTIVLYWRFSDFTNANLENNFTPLCITRTIIMTKTRDIPKAKCRILSIKFDGFLINVSDKFRTHHESQTKHILSIIVFFRVQLRTLAWVWYSIYERNAIFHQFCTHLKIYIF